MRHAHAGDPLAWSGDDAARPLSARGRRQAARLGAHLAALGLRPDAIVSSPKTRARETAAAIGASLGREVRLDARLAAGFDLRALRTLVEELGADTYVYGNVRTAEGGVDLVARSRGFNAPAIGSMVRVSPDRTYVFDTAGEQPRIS